MSEKISKLTFLLFPSSLKRTAVSHIQDWNSGRIFRLSQTTGKKQVDTAAMLIVETLLVEFHENYPNQDLPNPVTKKENVTEIAPLNVYLFSRTLSLTRQNSFWIVHQNFYW